MDFSLDWRSIAGVVAPVAPKLGAVLGTAIGGPFGSVIGGLAGNAIAAIFNVEATPEAVGKAIAEDPKAADKLAKLEAERGQQIIAQAQAEIARAEQTGLTQRANVEAINETKRAEIADGVSWWHWRHLIGYVTMSQGAVFVIGSAKIMFFGGDIGSLAALVTAITPVFLGLCALNGYVAADTTALKTAAITGQQPQGAVASVVRAATGKR